MNLKEIETPDLHKLLGHLDAVADFIRGGDLKWYFDARLFDCEGTLTNVRALIKRHIPIQSQS